MIASKYCLFILLICSSFSSFAQRHHPTPRADYKFSKPHYLHALKSMDSLTIDTSVIYVSMIKRVNKNTHGHDTTYHVYRFFGNGVFYSKTLTSNDSLKMEINHPCVGGVWGMYMLEDDYVVMESEEKNENGYQRKYTHAFLDENELYLDHVKVGNKMFKIGGEDTYTTYLKRKIELRNWHICWGREVMRF